MVLTSTTLKQVSAQLLFMWSQPLLSLCIHRYYPVSEVTYQILGGNYATENINVLRQVIEQLRHRVSVRVLFHLCEAVIALYVHLVIDLNL